MAPCDERANSGVMVNFEKKQSVEARSGGAGAGKICRPLTSA
jgi:hypothetical protein